MATYLWFSRPSWKSRLKRMFGRNSLPEYTHACLARDMWGGCFEVFEFVEGQARIWYADSVPQEICETVELSISEEAALKMASWWVDWIDGPTKGNQIFVPEASGCRWRPLWTSAGACLASLHAAGLATGDPEIPAGASVRDLYAVAFAASGSNARIR